MNLSSDTFGFKYRVRHPLTLDRGPGTGVRGCVTRSPHTSTPPPPWHEETRLLGRVSFLLVEAVVLGSADDVVAVLAFEIGW